MTLSKKAHNQCQQIPTGRYRFQKVSNFSYLGSVINDDKSISKETTHRIKK